MAADADPQSRPPKVLVVEDEMLVQMLIVDVVTDLGLEAIEATDAPSALEALRGEDAVALMVPDVGLPGMNGRVLADEARALRPGLKVLFVTGYGENPALSGLGDGFGVITKPFLLDDLSRKVAGMLGMA